MRLHDIVEHYARDQPDAVALRDGARRLTYRELDAMADSFADALVAAGVGPGDRFATLAANCLEFVAWYFGGAKVGAVTVPLNQRLAPREWAYILDDSRSRLVVARGDLVAALDGIRGELPPIETFVALGASRPGWHDWEGWRSSAPARTTTIEPIRPDHAAIQMYTSGTTGRPKGAVLSHASLMASITQLLTATTTTASGCVHVVAPLSHVGSTMVALVHLIAGGSVFVQEAFDPHEVVRILDEEQINSTMLVPAMIQAMLTLVPDVAEREYRDLELMGYGAAPIAPETLRRAMGVFDCDFFQGFGQTEASGSVAFLTPADHHRALAGEERLLRSAGRATIGTELRIVHPDGNECATGEIGEILARGPQLMTGYWNLSEESEAALRDGWLHLGDAGTLDDEGYLYIKDRIKDMIVSGGENVYPAEVEHVLFEHDAIADAAVVGVPDETWGEAVKAFVVLKPGIEIDEADLVAFCRSRIAGFKVPKSVVFVQALPRNASMKVLKTELRAPFWKDRPQSIGS